MDLGTAGTALAALVAVIGLILVSARILRRYGLAPGAPLPGAARRLSVQEVLPLDTKRRLLLLRCDGREILLLTGGPQDLVLPAPERLP